MEITAPFETVKLALMELKISSVINYDYNNNVFRIVTIGQDPSWHLPGQS